MISEQESSSVPEIEAARYWLGWIDFAKSVAFFLVALGVVMEFVADRAEKPYRKALDDARELEIARLNENVELRRRDNLVLERAAAPRSLETTEFESIKAKGAEFASTPVIIRAYLGDVEAIRLAGQFASALHEAGWDIDTTRVKLDVPTDAGALVIGVLLRLA
jgi:hypothetical protein